MLSDTSLPCAEVGSPHEWRDLRFRFTAGRSGRDIWPPRHFLSRACIQRMVSDFTFWFFFQGSGELIDEEGTIYPLRAGVCLGMKPGVRFQARQVGDELLGDAFFHFDLFRGERLLSPDEWPFFPVYSEIADISFFDQTTRRILALLHRSRLPGYKGNHEEELEAEHLMKALFLHLLRDQKEARGSEARGSDLHHERVVMALLSALHEEPRQFRSVADLARAGGYSTGYFRSLCVKVTGKRPGELLINARMERAKSYLLHSEMTVGMIAESLGYENIYYFSRQFREVVGKTASEYRAHAIASQ